MLTKYELDNYEGAGFIFMTPQLDILLVNEKKSGKWGMCKGHRERKDGGNPTTTAIREANEELGLLPEDYEIWGEPFILGGSPKIYIFQRAILNVDIIDKFKINKLKTMYYKPGKLTEIKDIKLISAVDFMESIDDLNCNVYVKLFHAWMTGKFVHSHKKFYSPSMRSSMTDEEILTPPFNSSTVSTANSRTGSVISINSEHSNTDEIKPRMRFYNSSLIGQPLGSSPIQTMATNPIHSPIVITQKESSFIPPHLELGEAERASPIRDRAESRNSLYEGLSPRASPVPPYPFVIDRTGSPTRGGGAGGPVSPRTCASFLLPGSPAILDSSIRIPTPHIR